MKTVFEEVITAGNASQLSDGASAAVLMDSKLAEQRNLEPLGAYKGVAVAGLDQTRWESARSIFPKLLERLIYRWTTSAYGSLTKLSRYRSFTVETSKIPNELLNVNGGAISIGHPYGIVAREWLVMRLLKAKDATQNMSSALCVEDGCCGII